MKPILTTYVRAALAICVIVVTFDLTLSEPTELGQRSAGLSAVPAKNALKTPSTSEQRQHPRRQTSRQERRGRWWGDACCQGWQYGRNGRRS